MTDMNQQNDPMGPATGNPATDQPTEAPAAEPTMAPEGEVTPPVMEPGTNAPVEEKKEEGMGDPGAPAPAAE